MCERTESLRGVGQGEWAVGGEKAYPYLIT